MNHHLKYALRSDTTGLRDCTEKAFESVLNVINKTKLNSEKMEEWNSIFKSLRDYNKIVEYINFYDKNNDGLIIRTPNNTMKEGRHSFPFLNKNNEMTYLDCMSEGLRSLYVGYSDRICLSQVVAGLNSPYPESSARNLRNQFAEYRINQFSKSTNWFYSEMACDIDKYKNEKGFEFLKDHIIKDFEEFRRILVEVKKLEIKEVQISDDLVDRLNHKNISKINIKDMEYINNKILDFSKSLSIENKINPYIYETFADNKPKKEPRKKKIKP